MALLFFEGFENKEPAGRLNLSYGIPGANVGFVAGRSSGSAVRCTAAVANAFARVNWASASSGKFTVSAAFRVDAIVSTLDLIKLSTPTGGNDHVTLTLLATGALRLSSSAGSVTSAYTMAVGEWARVDLIANVAESPDGWAECWVNGVKVCEQAGDTRNNNEAGAIGSAILGLGPTNGTRVTIDDVYVTDGTGPAPYNGRIGDVRIETIVPTGNGSKSQFVGSDGNSVDNYQLVDEMPASSTDYVTSANAGDQDLYAMGDLSIPTGVVHAVQVHYLASKTDSGAASLIPLTKLGATVHKDANLGLGLTPVYAASSIRTVDPDGAAWTVAKVNAAEFGVEAGT